MSAQERRGARAGPGDEVSSVRQKAAPVPAACTAYPGALRRRGPSVGRGVGQKLHISR